MSDVKLIAKFENAKGELSTVRLEFEGIQFSVSVSSNYGRTERAVNWMSDWGKAFECDLFEAVFPPDTYYGVSDYVKWLGEIPA